MSTIKANKHQIGQDVTPANNIVLTSSNGDLIVNQGVHDGTLTEIARFSADGLSGSDVVYTPRRHRPDKALHEAVRFQRLDQLLEHHLRPAWSRAQRAAVASRAKTS